MARIFVADASPLVFLARVGHLSLLTRLADEVLVPTAVIAELRAGADRDRAAEAVLAVAGYRSIAVTEVPERVVQMDLGTGESQVIAVALSHPSAEAILDDLAARRCASALKVPFIGTLGLLSTARRRDLIPALKPLLDELRTHGMYLTPELRAAALAAVGEQE